MQHRIITLNFNVQIDQFDLVSQVSINQDTYLKTRRGSPVDDRPSPD